MLEEVVQTWHQAYRHTLVTACTQGFLDFGDILGCDHLDILIPIHHQNWDFDLAQCCTWVIREEVAEPRRRILLNLRIHHPTVLLRLSTLFCRKGCDKGICFLLEGSHELVGIRITWVLANDSINGRDETEL